MKFARREENDNQTIKQARLAVDQYDTSQGLAALTVKVAGDRFQVRPVHEELLNLLQCSNKISFKLVDIIMIESKQKLLNYGEFLRIYQKCDQT